MNIEKKIDSYLDEATDQKRIYKTLKQIDKFDMEFKSKLESWKKQLKGSNKIIENLELSYKHFSNAAKEINKNL